MYSRGLAAPTSECEALIVPALPPLEKVDAEAVLKLCPKL